MFGVEAGTGLETVALVSAGAAMGIVAAVLIAQCVQNLRFILAYRRDVARRLGALRLPRMLGALGVGRHGYLARASNVQVERQLWRCEHCPSTAACDRALESGDLSRVEAFCPNFGELRSYRRRSH